MRLNQLIHLIFVGLFATLLMACQTMHLPNAGFEDAVPVQTRQGKLSLGGGNTQSLNFNDFETTQNKDSVKTGNVGSLVFGGATGITKELEVSVHSYLLPFPGIVGLKYQFYGSAEDAGPFSASVAIKYGYSAFSNKRGHTSIGGSCTANCTGEPNGRSVYGGLSAYTFGLPLGYQFTDRVRVTLNPQITYFGGKYTLYEKISDTETKETPYGLSGLRKTVAVNALYKFARAWDAQLSCQVHDNSWNGIKSSQSLSAFLGVSYLIGAR